MPNWIHRTNSPPDYLVSVSEFELPSAVANWLQDPDLSAVAAVPRRYWQVVGSAVQEMTQTEKDAVDAALLAATKADEKVEIDTTRTLKAIIEVLVDEINVLRAAVIPPLAARTYTQARNAIKGRIDTL